jgi:hypothetical protein
VIDREDEKLADATRALGLEVVVTQTIMRSDQDRGSLARDCIELLKRLGA